jgi:hypothetical protein
VILMPGSNLVCMMAGTGGCRCVCSRPARTRHRAEADRHPHRRRPVPRRARGRPRLIGKYQWWLVGGLFALSFLQSGRKMKKASSAPDGRPARLTRPTPQARHDAMS